MYPGNLAKKYEDRPAFIMASTGETVTYSEFEERSNQLAHFFRDEGLEKAKIPASGQINTGFNGDGLAK